MFCKVWGATNWNRVLQVLNLAALQEGFRSFKGSGRDPQGF